MNLIKIIAEYFGYRYCPSCHKFFRTEPVLMRGLNLCNRCASIVISNNIKAWYGDYQS